MNEWSFMYPDYTFPTVEISGRWMIVFLRAFTQLFVHPWIESWVVRCAIVSSPLVDNASDWYSCRRRGGSAVLSVNTRLSLSCCCGGWWWSHNTTPESARSSSSFLIITISRNWIVDYSGALTARFVFNNRRRQSASIFTSTLHFVFVLHMLWCDWGGMLIWCVDQNPGPPSSCALCQKEETRISDGNLFNEISHAMSISPHWRCQIDTSERHLAQEICLCLKCVVDRPFFATLIW